MNGKWLFDCWCDDGELCAVCCLGAREYIVIHYHISWLVRYHAFVVESARHTPLLSRPDALHRLYILRTTEIYMCNICSVDCGHCGWMGFACYSLLHFIVVVVGHIIFSHFLRRFSFAVVVGYRVAGHGHMTKAIQMDTQQSLMISYILFKECRRISQYMQENSMFDSDPQPHTGGVRWLSLVWNGRDCYRFILGKWKFICLHAVTRKYDMCRDSCVCEWLNEWVKKCCWIVCCVMQSHG